jgi:hypothetical protein
MLMLWRGENADFGGIIGMIGMISIMKIELSSSIGLLLNKKKNNLKI